MLKLRTVPEKYTEEEWKKLVQEEPKTLLTSNSKLRKANIWSFAIPAAKATIVKNGELKTMTTCPSAGSCLNFCYAQSGGYTFSVSLLKHSRNLNFAINNKEKFKEKIINEIKSKRNLHAIRWHDSGDFFSKDYYMLIRDVMLSLPNVKFYAYTKSINLFRNLEEDGLIPQNFTYVFSFGGKLDDKINVKKDRHSKVFTSEESLKKAKYHHSSMDTGDKPASDKSIKKIGLVVHASIGHMKKFKKNGLLNGKEM